MKHAQNSFKKKHTEERQCKDSKQHSILIIILSFVRTLTWSSFTRFTKSHLAIKPLLAVLDKMNRKLRGKSGRRGMTMVDRN